MLIGICDDIINDAMEIKSICNDLGESDIYTFSSSEELLNSEILPNLDLLFLDIELKGDTKNGIDIKKILEYRAISTFIVFCTSHQEVMPNAFGRNVLFFLNKPVSKQSVKNCLERVSYFKKDFMLITINNMDCIACKDILYLRFEQKYTIFYSTDGSHLLSNRPIKEWETDLKELNFGRISRSTIVNLKHFIRYTSDKSSVLLHNNVRLNISRRYFSSFKEQLYDYHIQILKNGS